MKVEILIQSKDRPTELYGLLQSLRTQTYQNYNIWILDDASGIPVQQHHFINCIVNRMKCEGHRVGLIRNNQSKGISSARQQMVDHVMKHTDGDAFLRVDDDTLCEPDYLEKLVDTIKSGYDIASGITPPMIQPVMKRSTQFVKPVINRVVLDDDGNFLVNGDDCGHHYIEEEIILADHFRSSALITREVHEKVNYEDNMTPCGFREEEFFSFRAILAGFKIGVHTGSVNWHIQTPSGGDRRTNYQDLAIQNQKMLNRLTIKKVKQRGDFIRKYHEDNNAQENEMASFNKDNNLIYYRGVD
jgi:glycosyltransferase involved in cell wall biosynthesis